MKLQVIYRDYVKCQIVGLTPEDRSKVYNHFSVFIPTARYMPSYKIGAFDGYKRYFSLTGQFYVNLLPELYSILDMSKYELEETYLDELKKDEYVFDFIDELYLNEYKWGKGHRLEGQNVEMFDHQVDIVNACLENHRCIVEAATGCHGKGTKILMYDGSWKNVEDIVVGDKIMGDDGTVRNVLSLHRGIDDMYKIIPTKSKPFIVNGGHILPVISNNKRKNDYKNVTYISVKDYLKKSNYYKHTHKIFNNKSQVKFNRNNEYIISPYIMGVYLGDGTSRGSGQIMITTMDNEIVKELNNEANKNNLKLVEHTDKRGNKAKDYSFNLKNYNDKNFIKEELIRYDLYGKKSIDKFIPDDYLYGSVQTRLEVLAGLIDTDGYLNENKNYIEYYTNSKKLVDNVCFICGSLGLKTYTHIKKNKTYPDNTYYRISICGNIDIIPTRIKRKKVVNKTPNKDCRHSAFKIEYIGKDNYYGFECDGNHLYIMEDWWVQHNSGKTLVALALAKQVAQYGRFIIIEPSRDLTLQTAQVFKDLGFTDVGVCGCGLRELDKKVTVCTWQTLNSINKRGKSTELSEDKRQLSSDELKQLVEGTIGLMIDETHTVKAHELGKMCETIFRNVPIRWGLTGTVPKAKSDYYSVTTALGPVVHHLESKELQDKGILAQCNVTAIKLKDEHDFLTYSDEMDYLSSNYDRLKFIGTLIHNITQSSGNTLVLVNRIKCGEILESVVNSLGTKCIYIDGATKSKKRFDEYESIKTENNKCIIATSGIAATGLDIPRLFNLVMLDYSKSFIRTIQSIGRGLRLGKDKNSVNIFDVFSTTTFSKKHFNDRVHFYNDKKFPFKVLDVETWK